jgi:hypothetical protein
MGDEKNMAGGGAAADTTIGKNGTRTALTEVLRFTALLVIQRVIGTDV